MRHRRSFTLFLFLCVMLACMCMPAIAVGDSKKMSPAIERLRQLGFDLSDEVLESIGEELHVDPDTLSVTDLLLGLGLGDYDYDTGEWTPRSRRVYAFDAEIFDIEQMYTLFLQGIQAIVPDITITDIHEDLSGMTNALVDFGDGTHPPTDGKRTVSFVCNGHAYSTVLDSYGDWFNEQMFYFMDQVLEKEGCPFKLYELQAQMQFVIVVYGSELLAAQLQALVQPY